MYMLMKTYLWTRIYKTFSQFNIYRKKSLTFRERLQ